MLDSHGVVVVVVVGMHSTMFQKNALRMGEIVKPGTWGGWGGGG